MKTENHTQSFTSIRESYAMIQITRKAKEPYSLTYSTAQTVTLVKVTINNSCIRKFNIRGRWRRSPRPCAARRVGEGRGRCAVTRGCSRLELSAGALISGGGGGKEGGSSFSPRRAQARAGRQPRRSARTRAGLRWHCARPRARHQGHRTRLSR